MAILNLVDNLILESIITGIGNLFKTELKSMISGSVKNFDTLIKSENGQVKGQVADFINKHVTNHINPNEANNFKQMVYDEMTRNRHKYVGFDNQVNRVEIVDLIKNKLSEFKTAADDANAANVATNAANAFRGVQTPKLPTNIWHITDDALTAVNNHLGSIKDNVKGFSNSNLATHAHNILTHHQGELVAGTIGAGAIGTGGVIIASNSKNSHTGVINANGQEMINPIAKGQHVVYASPEVPITKVEPNTVYVDPQTNTQFNPNSHDLSNGLVTAGVSALGAYGLYKYLKHKHRNDL